MNLIYPFLFAVYPVLSIFVNNLTQVKFSDILGVAILLLVGSAFILLLLQLVFRDFEKSGIFLSLFLLLFFSYGHVYRVVEHAIVQQEYLLIIYAFLFIGSFFIVHKLNRGKKYISSFLAVFAAVLMTILFFGLAFNFFKLANIERVYLGDKEAQLLNVKSRPDIYYIILDEYAGLNQIKNVYHYDNSEFANHLIKKGFFIAKESKTKVPSTGYSLATSLNMEYPEEKASPYYMIHKNKVARVLRALGYKYIHFGSWWLGTSRSEFADKNINLAIFNEVVTTLLSNSLFRSWVFSGTLARQDIVLNTFAQLAEIPTMDWEEPKFIFAHIICPHEPFVFGRNGEEIPFKDRTNWKDKSIYLGQYIFITRKVKTLVDKILSKLKRPSVIVIQSDHGVRKFKGADEIFNAYYLPYGGNKLLWNSIDPVDTFRVVFNYYFGARYKYLSADKKG
ncbi:MAG: hypothetical protein QXL34_06125 [Thermosphaera sp.]